MNGQQIFESLEYLEDQYLTETQTYLKTKKKKKDRYHSFYKVVTAAAIVLLVTVSGAIGFFHWSKGSDEKMIADFEKEIKEDMKIRIDGKTYDTGFDIDCSDGEEVTVYWDYDKTKLKTIDLYAVEEHQQRELTAEEMETKSITLTQSGHYFLYGMDTDGKIIDLTDYINMEYKGITRIDGEPVVGL